MWLVVSILQLSLSSPQVFAGGAENRSVDSWENRTARELQLQKKRFDGYFKDKAEREKWRKRRRAGVQQQKAHRAKKAERREKARQKHLVDRQNKRIDIWEKPETYEKYLEHKHRKKQRHEQARKQHIKGRDYLQYRLKSADKRLTDAQEYGFEK